MEAKTMAARPIRVVEEDGRVRWSEDKRINDPEYSQMFEEREGLAAARKNGEIQRYVHAPIFPYWNW